MRYMSLFSGIEAASVAWCPLGWSPAAFAEIDPFCSALLAERYPSVKNLGDICQIAPPLGTPATWARQARKELEETHGPIDLLVGGSPCQGFSAAGLRGGLDDARSNLALEFLRITQFVRPRWVVWENVPGVLSSGPVSPHTGERIKGYDFSLLLGGFTGVVPTIPTGGWGNAGVAVGPLYNVAWRVLDAQHFGIPQRRRRVFLVGYLGDWRPPAAVLFERESLRGNPATNRGARAQSATSVDGSPSGSRNIAATLNSGGNSGGFRTEPGEHLVVTPAIAAPRAARQAKGCFTDPVNDNIFTPDAVRVRKLTVTEAERLMGFEDGYTLVPYRNKPASDSSRYRVLGNSMAVPCMAWLGRRIQAVDDIVNSLSRKLEEAS